VGDPSCLFELNVVLAEVDADGFEAAEILIDDVGRRGLQDNLQLLVLVEAIGIFAVASIGGTAAWLYVGDAVRLGPSTRRKVSGHMVPAPTSMS